MKAFNLEKFCAIILTSVILLNTTSCSSVMKCTVYGKPGTTIYMPNGTSLGEINSSGKVKIEIPRQNGRHDLLYAKESSNSPVIPMGLDYDKRNSNELKMFLACLFIYPTLTISFWSTYNYINDNPDVEDKLKLHKIQNSNTDLAGLIYNSSSPYEEIKALDVKEHKSGNSRNSKASSKNLDLSWLDMSGEISDVSSVTITNKGKDYQIPFSGTIFYDIETRDGRPIITISGVSGKEKQDISFKLNLASQFRKKGDSYVSKEEFDKTEIKIVPDGKGNAILSFIEEGTEIKFHFDPNSFEEKSTEPTGMDYLMRLHDILGY